MHQLRLLSLLFVLALPIGHLIGQASSFSLSIGNVSAQPGEKICVPVSVANFQGIMSMQYSMQWDHAKLKFSGLDEPNLPYLNANNFGLHSTDKGIMTFVWIDNALKGVNRTDGEAIFKICFEVMGKIGDNAFIVFSDQPTPYEAVNSAEQLINMNTSNGGVTVVR